MGFTSLPKASLALSVILGFSSLTYADFKPKLISELLVSSIYHRRTDSPVNPNNRVLEIPTSLTTFEYRPDLSWPDLSFWNTKAKFVARGRFIAEQSYTEYENPQERPFLTKGRTDLSDLFFDWSITERNTVVLGLQNYQWGPAELYSPSNPFFHFSSQQKSLFYKEKGRVLTRWNYYPTDRLNITAVAEPISNNDPEWTADRGFSPKSIVKIEYQLSERSNYLAVMAGTGELRRPFFGEYMNFVVADGVSLYADAKHSQGRTHYGPQAQGPFYNLVEADADDKNITTFGILGVRYEGKSFDLREEYLYNEAGYTPEQWRQVQKATTALSPYLVRNLIRFGKPGLEFLTQHYSYTSLRLPDLGKKQDTNLYFRYLHAFNDNSGTLQFDADKFWNDSVVLYFETIVFLGSKGSELHLSDDYQISIGFKKTI